MGKIALKDIYLPETATAVAIRDQRAIAPMDPGQETARRR